MLIPPRNNKKESQPPSLNHNPIIASSSSFSDNFSSPPSMEPLVLPPGYKFEPTDEDVLYYLNGFLKGYKDIFHYVPIHRANIYESTPQQLSKEYDKGNDKEWFFITERTKKIEGGKHLIRKDNGGYWKNQVSKTIEAGHGVVGYRSALAYFTGGKENSVKSDWLMHEYWFKSNGDNDKVDHALCKIYLKSERARRRAENQKKKKMKLKMEEETAESLREVIDEPQQEQTRHQVPLDEFDQQQPVLRDYDVALYSSEFEPEVEILELDEFKNHGFLADDFEETINGPPGEQVIPDNDVANADYIGDLYPQLLEIKQSEESNNGYLEDILTQGMWRRHTDEFDEMTNMGYLYPHLPEVNNRYEETPKRAKRRAEEAENEKKKKMKIEEALEQEIDQPLNVAFQDSS